MPATARVIDLADVKQRVLGWAEALRDREGPLGCYRRGMGKRPDLYSSIDVAIMRTIMGEDLKQSLGESQRREWIEHINSYAVQEHELQPDGSYEDRLGHSALHANGQVVGGLGVLGGRQKFPCRLYDPFDSPEKVGPWLESEVDWRIPWSQSHKFWGGLHCFSKSRRCTEAWLESCFGWLNDHVDAATGWWHKDVTARYPHAYLGGAVHILPIYQHHGRRFEHIERCVDSTLALQQADGAWVPEERACPIGYLELDALYVYELGRLWSPGYRAGEVEASAARVADLAWELLQGQAEAVFDQHPHSVLAVVGALGLLQRLCPDRVHSSEGVGWTDIFSDERLYRTAAVEVLSA